MARRLPSTHPASDPRVESLEGLGAAVRNARAQARMRIDDAAAFCGVSADVLSRLENGKSITTDRLFKVLDGLGLEVLVVSREQALKLKDLAQQQGAE
ncbi:helix-turn-helix domain-containing protein [Paenacidovorax monticola]|uniref:Helix-turn-helix transcriptional regulator n=1 Tax=Paenacidovorax monticola TaxID=1926868 RepID=A0A7H0HHP4_9BURK|nr:helix-turn-helix transcriptional regulator [Paenacidovorax monticola]QNP60060.1 helix-turn-helix transcriptional regulator [Paenacidovorax monticola]